VLMSVWCLRDRTTGRLAAPAQKCIDRRVGHGVAATDKTPLAGG
jgi:hypothetical protein